MPSLTCFSFRFTPSWLMIILTTLSMALFIRLGFWQLQRADEKTKMVTEQAMLAKQESVQWDEKAQLPKQYQRIKIKGTYLSDIFLLDNQHYRHQFGYDVLSPLLLSNGAIVMIDRGWVPGDNSRQNFPEIKTPAYLVGIQGSVYFPSENQWILGAEIEKKKNNITVLEALKPKLLSQILQIKVYPFIIRLDKHDAYGFVREWEIVSMPPERHLAYALQWFVMAMVILIIFVALNLKKKNEKTSY